MTDCDVVVPVDTAPAASASGDRTCWPAESRRTGHVLSRMPVTLGLVAVLWAVGVVTGSVGAGPGPALRAAVGVGVPAVVAGRWWTPLTSALWCAGLPAYLTTTALLVVLVAPFEARIGSARTAALMAVTQVLGTTVGVGLVVLGSLTGDRWSTRLAADLAVGPSTAAVGVALAASIRLGPLWRRRLRVALVVALVMLALYSGSLQDVLRLVAGVVGLLLGPVLTGGRRHRRGFAASAPEARTLVALVVAASALGPLVAAVFGTAIGPLSVLRFLVLSPPPDPIAVQVVCADPASVDDCLGLQFRLRLGGVGPAVMSVLPVLLLVVLADGLRRGRRFAWWGAVGVNGLLAVLGGLLAVLTASTPAERLVAFGGASDGQFHAGVVASVAQPLAVVGLLLATRHRFAVSAPAAAYRRWAFVVGGALVGISALYLLVGHGIRDQFVPVPGWTDLLVDLPTRFLPPGYLGELEVTFLPVGPAATVLFEWSGVGFWAVALGASLWVLRCTGALTGDAETARNLLVRHGGSTLGWMSTWSGNGYWFDVDGRCGVAYRVTGRVALTVGEPFGAVEARPDAVQAFASFCAEHAWTPCFLQRRGTDPRPGLGVGVVLGAGRGGDGRPAARAGVHRQEVAGRPHGAQQGDEGGHHRRVDRLPPRPAGDHRSDPGDL